MNSRGEIGWESGIPWEVTASVAEAVAFDRGRPIGEVRGLAIAISAPGPWWFRPAPGVVLCTRDAARDATLAPIIVRAALDPEMAV